MIRKFQIEVSCRDGAEFAQQAAELAEALTVINMWELSTDQDGIPCCLSCGGVRYEEPTHCDDTYTCQRVRDIRGVYKHQQATCFDLACERAARLRLDGHTAQVIITHDGPLARNFHAYVESDNGDQDPAAELQAMTIGGCGCAKEGEQ